MRAGPRGEKRLTNVMVIKVIAPEKVSVTLPCEMY